MRIGRMVKESWTEIPTTAYAVYRASSEVQTSRVLCFPSLAKCKKKKKKKRQLGTPSSVRVTVVVLGRRVKRSRVYSDVWPLHMLCKVSGVSGTIIQGQLLSCISIQNYQELTSDSRTIFTIIQKAESTQLFLREQIRVRVWVHLHICAVVLICETWTYSYDCCIHWIRVYFVIYHSGVQFTCGILLFILELQNKITYS